MSQCLLCKEHYYFGTHRCKPKWYCVNADDYEGIPPAENIIDDGREVYSVDAEKAAIAFAERYQGENSWYPSEMTVFVMDADETKIWKYVVNQEPAPTYWVDYGYTPEFVEIVHEE